MQPRGHTVGLKDSPSLPPLLPSAMSHLWFTASILQLLEPPGHRGILEIHGLAQDPGNSGSKTKVRVKGYVQRRMRLKWLDKGFEAHHVCVCVSCFL